MFMEEDYECQFERKIEQLEEVTSSDSSSYIKESQESNKVQDDAT